ncbi:uncharacterized protein CCOS01_14481 [Colletotrichum costaricense]|uniref:C2H2-type domain-containing protein n=1 Tax=Colletotrichum costaricense TaxID=1209916 RepID=A0AAJ0DUF8_9PEZI|nr:uncharacterized protein CCOS01_14481 [Colletotrichum costaricense]KAK1513539.1 hypothetical protein CCOS01_14481 [Colletotrichum costaricense]
MLGRKINASGLDFNPTAALTRQFSNLGIDEQSESTATYNLPQDLHHQSSRSYTDVTEEFDSYEDRKRYAATLAATLRNVSYSVPRRSHSIVLGYDHYSHHKSSAVRRGGSSHVSGEFGGSSGGGAPPTPAANLSQQPIQQASTSGPSQDSQGNGLQDSSVPVPGTSHEDPGSNTKVTSSSPDEAVIAEPGTTKSKVESIDVRPYPEADVQSTSLAASIPDTWKPQESWIDREAIGTTNEASSLTQSAKRALLACPYIKHDPLRYSQRRGCRGAAFPNTSRLKEHLHRTHRQKPNCPRCRGIFKTELEVIDHLQAQSLCKVVQDEGDVEGFDAAQEKLLRSKKRRKGVDTEEDKWEEIFKILFPDQKDVPGPFYKMPVNDQTAVDQAQEKEQDDAESIFTKDLPSLVEEEMSLKMEEAVGGHLTKQERGKLLNVFRGFAVKMLRQSKEGDVKDKEFTLTSKSSQTSKSYGNARSAGPPSERLQHTNADDKLDEKLEVKQHEVYASHEAQTLVPPIDPVMALSSLPSAEATEPRSMPLYSQAVRVDMESDVACWPVWDAAFVDDNGDSWLDDLLGTSITFAGGLAQAQDKTFGVEPMKARDGVDTIPARVQHVVGQDYTS